MSIRLLSGFCFFAFTFLHLGIAAAEGVVVDRIAAVVNDDLLLLSEVDERITIISGQAGAPVPTGVELDDTRRIVLEEMIGERLIEQAIVRLSIDITDERVDAAIREIASYNDLTAEQLMAEVVRSSGLDAGGYREELRKQLRYGDWRDHQIAPLVHVTEEEARTYYRQNFEDTAPTGDMVELSRILLRYDAETRGNVETQAQALVTQLEEGMSFGDLARSVSEDPTTSGRGGMAGSFALSELLPAMRAALQEAELGSHHLIDLGQGFMVLKLTGRPSAETAGFEDRRMEIFQLLQQEEEATKVEAWVADQRERAHLEVRL